MAIINLGRVGLVQKSTWQSGVVYRMLDIVKYGSRIYVCKVITTTAVPTDTTQWEFWVEGVQGATGPAGPAGPAGPVGPTGFTSNVVSAPFTIPADFSSMFVGTVVIDSTLTIDGNLGVI